MPKLTALKVKNAAPGVYGDGEGLYLRVKPSGARSWVLRVQYDGKREDIGLGSLADLTLEEARDKARSLRKLARQGKSARHERDREKARKPTFAEATTDALAELSKGWVERTAASYKAHLETYAVPKIGQMRVDAVEASDIIVTLAPIWSEKPAAARVTRFMIMRVLAFAKARGWRVTGLPDMRELRTGLSKQKPSSNNTAMPYAEVPTFVASEMAKAQSSGRGALLFTILTAARSGETRKATWEQIDLEARTWSRPASIMKTRTAHVVTLSEAAVNFLKQWTPKELRKGPIFTGTTGGPLSSEVMIKVMERALRPETVHGFRSSFRDWAAEQMPTVPAMVAEMALAHKVGTATEQAYLRSDLRQLRFALMDAWGRFVAPALSGVADNVTPLRKAEAG